MITQLRLENFKSWQSATLDFSKLNIFFGANSSGKTAVLQSLLLLKQTATTDLSLNFGGTTRDFVDFGDFAEIVFGHDTSRVVSVSLTMLMASKAVERTFRQHFDIELWNRVSQNRFLSGGLSWYLENGLVKRNDAKNRIELFTEGQAKVVFDLNAWLSVFSEEIRYLGPIRENPNRTYRWRGTVTEDIGQRGEYTIDLLIYLYLQEQHGFKESYQNIINSLVNIGVVDAFVLNEPQSSRLFEPRVRTRGSSVDESLVDVGFGVAQVLPVLTILFAAPPSSIVLIEHPELHLHPAAQSALGDVLIEAVKARDLQLIIESHSEHLLRRIQRRMAEDVISRDDVALYYCRNENGASIAERLQLDESGNIRNWIKGFFADDALLEDMFAVAQASIKEQGQSRS